MVSIIGGFACIGGAAEYGTDAVTCGFSCSTGKQRVRGIAEGLAVPEDVRCDESMGVHPSRMSIGKHIVPSTMVDKIQMF
jgi:hypothetical protein